MLVHRLCWEAKDWTFHHAIWSRTRKGSWYRKQKYWENSQKSLLLGLLMYTCFWKTVAVALKAHFWHYFGYFSFFWYIIYDVLFTEICSTTGSRSSSHTLYMDITHEYCHHLIFGVYQRLCRSSIHRFYPYIGCELSCDIRWLNIFNEKGIMNGVSKETKIIKIMSKMSDFVPLTN